MDVRAEGPVTCPGPHSRKEQRPVLNVQCDLSPQRDLAVSEAAAGMSSVFRDHCFRSRRQTERLGHLWVLWGVRTSH